MTKALHFWKIWLMLNTLTKEVDNDYYAEVSTIGNTLRNEDIARAIVRGRSEVRYETILSILNERDAAVLEAVLAGSSVQDGVIHITPRVTGNWIGADPGFDPKAHKITVDAFPTAELRTALDSVGVEVLGKKLDGGAIIGLVTDVYTGKTDGTVTIEGEIIIDGSKIKLLPLDGSEGTGIFFVTSTGTTMQVTDPLVINDPSRIICRVPPVRAGEYTLRIVTRFTSGSHLLKQPRTIEYELPLTAVGPTAKES
jgi:hypothetical protein